MITRAPPCNHALQRRVPWLGAGTAMALAVGLPGGNAIAQVAPQVGPPPAACSPTSLARIVIRDISPGVAAADPRAQPRTMYRRGATQFRSEEQPDMGRGGETRLVVISEPDVWMIDLARGQGAHSLDPGPELIVQAPVLPNTPDLPALFRTLEFGCEAAFVAAHAPTPSQIGSWGLSKIGIHGLSAGDYSLAFLVDSATLRPVIITYSKAGAVVFALRYDAYQVDQPDDASLFRPPASVQIIEAGAGTAKR